MALIDGADYAFKREWVPGSEKSADEGGDDRTATGEDWPADLLPQHVKLLEDSKIPATMSEARGYRSIVDKTELADLGITTAGRRAPGLLIPHRRIDGSVWGYQFRPDDPRRNSDGKFRKYETPIGQRNGIDVPPGVGDVLGDPSVELWVTEGIRKADSATAAGLPTIALPGVWGWRGTNDKGGKAAVADWHDVALNGRRIVLAFDGDVLTKPAVGKALSALAGYVSAKGATVRYCHLPADAGGLDDVIAAGYSVDDLRTLVKPDRPRTADERERPRAPRPPEREAAAPVDLDDCHAVFSRWLGGYDLGVLDAVLAVAACEQLDGDPPWLHVVGGSGAAKTETVTSILDAPRVVSTSSISSEGALLSGTAKREIAEDATGGLLRQLGDSGILVVKDFTTTLSMSRETRAAVLSALREVADGSWVRSMGVDGGTSIEWVGRVLLITAVTTAWDTAHAVVSLMGDRFVLVRMSGDGEQRTTSGRQALGNIGDEREMRAELRRVAAGVLATVDPAKAITLDESEVEIVLAAANLVSWARTAVEFDQRGTPTYAHAPEAPTRFAKQLAQVVRGAVAIGKDRRSAVELALRCARDTVPPLRLALLEALTDGPATATEVTELTRKPPTTVRRNLDGLQLLGLVERLEPADDGDGLGRPAAQYVLADGIDPGDLNPYVSEPPRGTRDDDNKNARARSTRGRGGNDKYGFKSRTP